MLQEDEWVSIYNSLPGWVRGLVKSARKPGNSFKSFLKGDGLKITALVNKERGRSSGGWVRVDDVEEARGRLRKYIPMLDKLIEPIMAGLINEVGTVINTILNKLGGAESVRGLLGQALDRLGAVTWMARSTPPGPPLRT